MADCEHKFVHLNTRRVSGERGSIGLYPGKDWERIDVFYCERCLEQKIIRQTASWFEFQDEPPWWW